MASLLESLGKLLGHLPGMPPVKQQNPRYRDSEGHIALPAGRTGVLPLAVGWNKPKAPKQVIAAPGYFPMSPGSRPYRQDYIPKPLGDRGQAAFLNLALGSPYGALTFPDPVRPSIGVDQHYPIPKSSMPKPVAPLNVWPSNQPSPYSGKPIPRVI